MANTLVDVFGDSLVQKQIDENELSKALIKYETSQDDNEKDSLWNVVINNFERLLEIENFGGIKTQNRYNENKLGSEFITLNQYYSENKTFTIHTLSSNAGHWNYVTKENEGNTNKIIYKKKNSSDYFTEIHELNSNEFLLFSRFDDMSFSCYNAYVIKYSDNKTIQQKAFKNKQQAFSVCSWTNVDESYTGKKDEKTGLYMIEGGMNYYEPKPILYDSNTHTISYTFNRLKDGKKITRKAKYKNRKFKIESYDVRTFDE